MLLPVSLLCAAVLLSLGFFLLVRRRAGGAVPSARLARLARVGGLSARLATSAAGARLRRLVTRRSRRAAYDEARRRRDAEAVTRAMGEMKGAFMKLGQ
ncbi:MAG TPA: hypothetical protein VFU21_19875, partial [Kofleriaceae bacterium]|nr:hypothetical protein [Kofleriaceae bacterium]